MIKVLFFARVKEELSCASLELSWRDSVADLNSLQMQLGKEAGTLWHEVLGRPNMIRAVNQAVVSGNCLLSDGDEVAFFPPVTGG